MARLIPVLMLVLTLAAAGPLRAEPDQAFAVRPYLDDKAVDLTTLLPPPPSADSPETRAELGDLLRIQVNRTPEMVTAARADAVEEVWRFADVVGVRFSPESLPRTATLFARLVATAAAVADPAKQKFGRKRPSLISDIVRPLMQPSSTEGSWPSSHAAVGTLMGIVLGNMLPEKRGPIMERAWAYAASRVIAGTDFPSDVEMGRIAGTVIAAALAARPDFVADVKAAAAELNEAFNH